MKSNYRTIGDVAKFFGMSISWIRMQETLGNFEYEDGARIEPFRRITPKGLRGSRYYTLDMIEAMAASLRRKYIISKYQQERISNIVNSFRKVEE